MPNGSRVWAYVPCASNIGPRGYELDAAGPSRFVAHSLRAVNEGGAGLDEILWHMPFGATGGVYTFDGWPELRRTTSGFLAPFRSMENWIAAIEEVYQAFGKAPWPYIGFPSAITGRAQLKRMVSRCRGAIAPWWAWSRRYHRELPGLFIDSAGGQQATSVYWQARMAFSSLGLEVVGCEPSAQAKTPWALDANTVSLITAQLWSVRIDYNGTTDTGYFLPPDKLPHELVIYYYPWTGSGISDVPTWLADRLTDGYSVCVGYGDFDQFGVSAADLKGMAGV